MTDSPPPAAPRGLDAVRRYTWWFLVPYPVAALALSSWQLIRQDRPAWAIAAILTSFVLVAAVSVRWFDFVTRDHPPPAIGGFGWIVFVLATAGLATSAIIAAPFTGMGMGWLTLPAALSTALVLRVPAAARTVAMLSTIAVTIAVSGVLLWKSLVSPIAVPIAALAQLTITLTLWIQWWNFDVARKLEQSRLVAGELAVAQERLRFAADLHDIQGQHLQVIALKGELAARLGPSRFDEAVSLMREVQELARDALSDTRAVVAGYRHVSPHTEVTNATRVLTAAGIRATSRMPESELDWSPEAKRDMGLLIREATTNILRHAEPTSAEFDMAQTPAHIDMSIRNDGGGAGASSDGGTGLTALRERFERTGGTLDWHRAGDRFTITARLPRITPAVERQTT